MERRLVLCPVVLLLILNASAKDKNKGILSAEVLRAQTVTVLIDPEAGEPLTDPSANRRAQEDVENALSKWGRFRIVLEARTADLVITVRKGTPRGATPTIRGGAIDDRPVIVQSDGSGDIRIGAQGGRPPSATEPRNRHAAGFGTSPRHRGRPVGGYDAGLSGRSSVSAGQRASVALCS
jgi:hypothetical protein